MDLTQTNVSVNVHRFGIANLLKPLGASSVLA